jgi:DtxR family Mn-dependent transcriptional regulator
MNSWIWLGLVLGLIGFLVWPRYGLLARWRQGRAIRARVQVEDALKHLYFCEVEMRRPTLASIAGRLQVSENRAAEIVQLMQDRGLAQLSGEALRLTPDGRAYALHIVRAHRLWERHLADETGFAEYQWHAQADQIEHQLTPADTDELASRLNYPLTDPHGDPIPTVTGELVVHKTQPLTAFTPGQCVRIIHLEDEPEELYAQLVANGFYPGMVVKVMDRSAQRIRLWADGDEHSLALLVAATITGEPVPQSAIVTVRATLADLTPPARGRVVGISPRCRGAERRRFLDLGFIPGTEVTAELVSPGGDPTAYRVRDTVIALRSEQARLINIDRSPSAVRHAMQTERRSS